MKKQRQNTKNWQTHSNSTVEILQVNEVI